MSLKRDVKDPNGSLSPESDKELAYTQPGEIDEASTHEELLAYTIPPSELKSLLRTLDFHIAPVLMILYLISFLDRSNLGNAAVGGLFEDINAPSNGLSVTTSIFYATYVTFEPFFTTILKSLRPSRLLPGVVIAWGAVLLGAGFIENYGALIAIRLLLGLLESALTPCLFLWLTFFYQRNELGQRTSYMFVSAALSGVVGGLIAAGFLKMDGLAGWAGWRYLFAIEGAITMVIGFASLYFIADGWQSCRFLSPRQKLLMKVREAQAAQFNGSQDFSWQEVRKAFTEPIVYVSGFVQFGFDVCLYGFSTFLPVIVRGLGYSTINSQLLTAPVYFWAAFVYLVGAYISDRKDVRYWLLMPAGMVTCVGYAILVGTGSTGASLFACFACATGIYLCVGLHVSWLNSNVAGVRKRATAIGIQQTLGNSAGVVSGQIYRSGDRPRYVLGHAISLGAMALALLGLTLETWIYKSRNARKLAMTEEEKEAEDAAGVVIGDRHHSFMYVY
ncbi:uncharacterized protein JCM6883_006066 [Sporobolomyces salmoneus]|uniref:uncharacterized protein n=1 Tax=Sporobolomyces salmoneus TaxID=183962 RepID=UPI0031768A7F